MGVTDEVPRRALGATGLDVSVVAYGAMRIEAGADGLSNSLLHALDRGVNLIDTARLYGPSEEIIGRTLRARGGALPTIATKVAPLPTASWRNYAPLQLAFTRQSIEHSVEQSLRALQVDVIDLLQLHQWYYLWTHEHEWYDAFDHLKRHGKIRFSGVSAQDHEHDALLQIIDARRVDVVQFVFNIFESRPVTSLLPMCAAKGIGTIARCVLDCGGLTGALSGAELESGDYFGKALPGEYLGRVVRLLSEPTLQMQETGMIDTVRLPELAIRFALTDPAISTITLSMPQSFQVDMNLAAAERGPLPANVYGAILEKHRWIKNFWA